MVTGAASATINHVPVLLLAGDMFAERVQAPVLQQLEVESCRPSASTTRSGPWSATGTASSGPSRSSPRFPRSCGSSPPPPTRARSVALPQDIQTYAFDYPVEMFEKRTWPIPRNRPDARPVAAAAADRGEPPTADLRRRRGALQRRDGRPARVRRADGHPGGRDPRRQGLDAVRPSAASAPWASSGGGGERVAPDADLVIGIGTRFTDFPTASKTAFQHPGVRFININVAEMDAFKHAALPLIGDARATIDELAVAVGEFRTSDEYQARVRQLNLDWDGEVERVYAHSVGDVLTQGEVIGAVEASADPRDVVVTSAGSLPGDLLKLWRAADAASYQVEYGYSTMGYEIAGGLGAKMAAPDREVYVMVGDGSFLMMSSGVSTAVQEGVKLVIVVVDNKGFSSVGRVSEQVGAEGFGCHYRLRGPSGQYDGEEIKVDFVKICEGLGARSSRSRRSPSCGTPSRTLAEAPRPCASSSRPTGTSASVATPRRGGRWRPRRSPRCPPWSRRARSSTATRVASAT